MTTKTDLINLFDKIIAAKDEQDEATAIYDDFENNAQQPEQPKIVENLDNWFAYEEALNLYNLSMDALKRGKEDAELAYKRIENLLLEILPRCVWFKHTIDGKVYGIGKAYSNWGGPHTWIVIAPWAYELPTLDRTAHHDN